MSTTSGGQTVGSGSTPASDVAGEGPRPAADESSDGVQFVGESSDPVAASWMEASRQQGRPTKKPKIQVDHSRGVPVCVQEAIAAFIPPQGYKVLSAPAGAHRSMIYSWGVRMVHKDAVADKSGGVKQQWACLASEGCRLKGTKLAITVSQTSNATQHICSAHNIKSGKSVVMEGTKKRAEVKKQTVLTSTLFQDDPDRFIKVEFVKAVHINAMIPFAFGENPRVRHLLSVICPTFDASGLHNRATKKILAEIYAASLQRFAVSMLKTIRNATVPIGYLNVDLWTSKVSGEKYIGVRIFYLDEKMQAKSHLLAVKLFRPPTSVGRKISGAVLLKWLWQVLAQFGLEPGDIAGAVTDAGSDVKGGVGSEFSWEWCIPHLLNRVTTDGSGMATDPKKSKNILCRALLELIKKVVEHFNRSQPDKIALEEISKEASKGKPSTAKLAQAVHHRWVSLAKMVKRVLSNWENFENVYIGTLKKAFPLAGRKAEVEEVYSILNAVKSVIESCQTTGQATGQDGIQNLVLLMTTTFEPTESLVVEHVQLDGKEGDIPSEERPHHKLTKVGQETRMAFNTAIAARVVDPRYGKGLAKHSHLFDMQMLLCPSTRSMKYLERVKLSTVGQTGNFVLEPADVRQRVCSQLSDLIVKAVETRRARNKVKEAEEEEADGGAPKGKEADGGAPKTKRPKGAAAKAPLQVDKLKKAGMFDSDDEEDDDGDDTPKDLSSKEQAAAVLKKWQQIKVPRKYRTVMSAHSTCAYWREHGDSVSPDLRSVAQSVLGAPASAAVLERDFCVAGQIVSRQRGSLDPAFVEILLFLRGAYDLIPTEVPKLTHEQAIAAIPKRLRDAAQLEDVRMLDVRLDDEGVDTDASEDNDSDQSSEDERGATPGKSDATPAKGKGNARSGSADGGRRGCDGSGSAVGGEGSGSSGCSRRGVEGSGGEGGSRRGGEVSGGKGGSRGSCEGSGSGSSTLGCCVDPDCPLSAEGLIDPSHRCPICEGHMHGFCGVGVGPEGYGQPRLCGKCASR